MNAVAWTRRVRPAADLWQFLINHTEDREVGHRGDPPGEPTPSAWLGESSPCQGDGRYSNQDMVTCGDDRHASIAGTFEVPTDVEP